MRDYDDDEPAVIFGMAGLERLSSKQPGEAWGRDDRRA
jgi:hypothetical protein